MNEQEKKRRGMDLAAGKNDALLQLFRKMAIALSKDGEPVSIEDVRAIAEVEGLEYTPGNWMGSVFKGDNWKPYGWIPCRHRESHGRHVRTWVR